MPLPATPRKTAAVSPKRSIEDFAGHLTSLGFDDWTASSKNGMTRFKGRIDDQTVTFQTYRAPGLVLQSASKCEKLPVKRRREEARKLRRKGHTQVEIADRLGVSQKTISNDLRA